jgi:putative redox protein
MADAPPHKPPTRVELLWEHDLVFAATSGSVRTTLDSASVAGQSPMQALAFGLAGCMSMDLVHILRKSRLKLTGLKADLTGHRASETPHRFVSVDLHFTVIGNLPADQIQRAIDLSREKYCSVWHSMRQDIEFNVTFEVMTAV